MTEIHDSRKPWAVLHLVANGGREIQIDRTRYFWTGWGARRYVKRIGGGAFFKLKAVRND